MEKVAFYTLGCKVNQYETDSMMSQFEARGYEIVDFNEPADIYIVNTCTVTHLSDRKSRQMLRRGRRTNPRALVVAVGCYPQVNPEILKSMPEVDLFLGNLEKARIVDCVQEALTDGGQPSVEPVGEALTFSEMSIKESHDKTRAFIKIQDGCNQFCSYCIIPYARGRSRSRPADKIIAQVRELTARGYREAVLTGIHLESYGRDLEKTDLWDLLKKLHEATDIERIRLGSLDPGSIPLEIFDWPKIYPRLCPHFHLSLQSGSAGVLKRMNRHYTPEAYEATVKRLRTVYPRVSITTDLIVGFPGETEEEFLETKALAKTLALSDIHVFKYSDRSGTRASGMAGKISEQTKHQRSAELIRIGEASKKSYMEQFVGETVSVLFETREGDQWTGHSREYLKVTALSRQELSNAIRRVRLLAVAKDRLIGEITP